MTPSGWLRTSPAPSVSTPAARPPPGKATHENLNAAIDAGDWAVVGATAALLADSADSDHSASGSLLSEARSARSTAFSVSSNPAGRVQELDRMVIGGDWEGIVLAAAQFGGGTTPREDDPTGSDDASATRSRNREEARREVEKLARRVVPDEVSECPAREFGCRVRRFWDGA